MKIKTIYKRVSSLWPVSISLSGYKKVDSDGYIFPELSKYWEIAEAAVSNDWEDLGVWVYYSILHEMAVEYVVKNIWLLNVKELNLTEFSNRFTIELKNYDLDMYNELLSKK